MENVIVLLIILMQMEIAMSVSINAHLVLAQVLHNAILARATTFSLITNVLKIVPVAISLIIRQASVSSVARSA